MSIVAVRHMDQPHGVEIHIGLDDKNKAIYCEGEVPAKRIARALYENFSLNTLVGREQEIPTRYNGQVKVFPILFGDPNKNTVIVRTADPLLAAGLEAVLKSPCVHVSSIAVFPHKDGERRSGRRSHSTRK